MTMIAPDVTPEPVPSVRLTAPESEATFGGGSGTEAVNQQVQKVSTEAGDIATFEKIRADQTAINDNFAKASDKYIDLVTNPQTGVLAAKGVNALTAQDNALTEFKKYANELSSNLIGPTQIGPFNKKVQALYAQMHQQTNGHVMQQLDEHQQSSYEAVVGKQTTIGALAYGDPKTNKSILDQLQQTTDAHAKLTGLDPDETQSLKMKVSSNYYENTIDQMLKDPKMAPVAQYYYDQNKDGVTLPARDRIEKALTDGNERYEIQDAMKAIMTKYPDSETDALKAVDNYPNVDPQKLRQGLSSEYQQDRAARKNDQDNTFMDAIQKVAQAGGHDPYQNISMIDPATKAKLSAEQVRAIEKYGSLDETSMSKWADFQEQIKNKTLTAMPKADLMSKYIQYFKPSDQKQALDDWASARDANSPKALSATDTARALDAAAVSAGLIPAGKRNTNQIAVLKNLMDSVMRDTVMFEDSTGKRPGPKEAEQIRDKRVIELVGNKKDFFGNLFNSSQVKYENIPENAKEDILAIAKHLGAKPTRQDIEKAYVHYQAKDKNGIDQVFK